MSDGIRVTGDHEYFERLVQFRPQLAGQPVKDFGNNASVARGGSAGVYTTTFQDKPKGFSGISYSIGNNLANDIRPTVVSGKIYDEATGVLNLTIFADKTTGAVAADIAANANNIVWLWVRFRNTAKI